MQAGHKSLWVVLMCSLGFLVESDTSSTKLIHCEEFNFFAGITVSFFIFIYVK